MSLAADGEPLAGGTGLLLLLFLLLASLPLSPQELRLHARRDTFVIPGENKSHQLDKHDQTREKQYICRIVTSNSHKWTRKLSDTIIDLGYYWEPEISAGIKETPAVADQMTHQQTYRPTNQSNDPPTDGSPAADAVPLVLGHRTAVPPGAAPGPRCRSYRIDVYGRQGSGRLEWRPTCSIHLILLFMLKHCSKSWVNLSPTIFFGNFSCSDVPKISPK